MSETDDRRVTCPHCKGMCFFKTLPQHPRGAGHSVPCSKCAGNGVVKAKGK